MRLRVHQSQRIRTHIDVFIHAIAIVIVGAEYIPFECGRIASPKAPLSWIILSRSVLILRQLGFEEQALVGEWLTHVGRASAGVAGETLREGVELASVRGVVIAVEIEVQDAAGTGDRSRVAGGPNRSLVHGIDILIPVAVAVAGVLVNDELAVRRVNVPLHDVAA